MAAAAAASAPATSAGGEVGGNTSNKPATRRVLCNSSLHKPIFELIELWQSNPDPTLELEVRIGAMKLQSFQTFVKRTHWTNALQKARERHDVKSKEIFEIRDEVFDVPRAIVFGSEPIGTTPISNTVRVRNRTSRRQEQGAAGQMPSQEPFVMTTIHKQRKVILDCRVIPATHDCRFALSAELPVDSKQRGGWGNPVEERQVKVRERIGFPKGLFVDFTYRKTNDKGETDFQIELEITERAGATPKELFEAVLDLLCDLNPVDLQCWPAGEKDPLLGFVEFTAQDTVAIQKPLIVHPQLLVPMSRSG